MKTYLLDTLNRYNRFSENLDVKTILCNKSWWIFNDFGDKELYIFQENGSLIASVNGNVINATWQYISANKSLVISFKEQSYMLHPSFIDNTIFALQQDGTERFLFMINEEQCNSFYPKSLKELNAYFDNIEHRRIKAKREKRKLLLKQQQRERRQAKINQQEEIERGEILEIYYQKRKVAIAQCKWIIGLSQIMLFIIVIAIYAFLWWMGILLHWSWFIILIILGGFTLPVIPIAAGMLKEYFIKRYISKENLKDNILQNCTAIKSSNNTLS